MAVCHIQLSEPADCNTTADMYLYLHQITGTQLVRQATGKGWVCKTHILSRCKYIYLHITYILYLYIFTGFILDFRVLFGNVLGLAKEKARM